MTQTKREYNHYSQSAMRYAQVLYELHLSEETIQSVSAVFQEVPQLREVLVNPIIREVQKMKVMDEIFPVEIQKFLKVVCRHQKMDILPEIFAAYSSYCDEQNKILHAELLCTESPNEEQLQQMETFLCEKYKASEAQIIVKKKLDLLGGFVLRVRNDEYDWSIQGRIERLKEKLMWR